MMLSYSASIILSSLAVTLAVPPVRRWARRVGFLDKPAGVKTHKEPTALGGGLAVFAGMVVSILLLVAVFGLEIPRSMIGILAGATLALLIGLYDDYFEMGPLPKIIGEFIAAVIFLSFAERYPPIISLPAYILLTSVWIVGLQNAINFIDNLDGMCGGISLTIGVGFGILFILKGMPAYAILSFVVAGAALGFLSHNMPPASIFLGDAGSLLFGFILSCLGIIHLDTSKSLAAALAPILIMAFPIFDMTLVTLTRLNKGLKVYVASKDHSWDMIRVLGLTREATVNSVLLINLMLVASGILIFFIEGSPIQMLTVVGCALLLAFIGTQLYKNFLFLQYNVLGILVDLIAINLSFIAYYFIKYWSGILSYSSVVPPEVLAVPLAWINMYWIILYSATGLYDISFERRLNQHILILLKSVVAGALIFLIVNYKPGEGFQISLSSIAAFIILLFAISALFRTILNKYLKNRLKNEKTKLNAVIVRPSEKSGSGRPKEDPARFYAVKGFVGPCSDSDPMWLGEQTDLSNVLRATKTARVILDIDSSDYGDLRNIFSSPYYMETIILVPSEIRDNLKGLRRFSTTFAGLDIISNRHRQLFPMIFRRLSDVFLSLFLIVVFSPFWALKILKIKLKEDKVSENIVLVDHRESPLGLKCFSGDKNPVRIGNPWILLAALKGNLTFYGVTINSLDEYQSLKKKIPGFWKKFMVKPGIFGPGYRGANPQKKFELDLEFLEKTSFMGDIMMIIKQVFSDSAPKESYAKHA